MAYSQNKWIEIVFEEAQMLNLHNKDLKSNLLKKELKKTRNKNRGNQ